MSEIVAKIPWQCGDRDCSYQWHLRGYAYNDETGSPEVSDFIDDDWDSIDELEMPSAEAEMDAWKRYSEYVLQTGCDPLEEFQVETHTKRKRRFIVRVLSWIGQSADGILLHGACPADRGPRLYETPDGPLKPNQSVSRVPADVWEYLGVQKTANRWTFPAFKTLDALKVACGDDVRWMKTPKWAGSQFEVEIEIKTPRSEAAIVKDRKRIAREHLAR